MSARGAALENRNELFEELEGLLGVDKAVEMAEYFAGSHLYVAKGILLAKKHEKIKKEFAGGISVRELARRYEYTETHIRRIIGGKAS
jgi:Mor family transcriptional regulator